MAATPGLFVISIVCFNVILWVLVLRSLAQFALKIKVSSLEMVVVSSVWKNFFSWTGMGRVILPLTISNLCALVRTSAMAFVKLGLIL